MSPVLENTSALLILYIYIYRERDMYTCVKIEHGLAS